MASAVKLYSTNNSTLDLSYQGISGVPKTVVIPDRSFTVAGTDEVIGVGQTWQNVTGSRVLGTTYTNSTGKPIMVSVSYSCNTANTVQGLIISDATVYAGAVDVANTSGGFSLIVPNGATYVTTTNIGVMTLVAWAELR